MGFFQRKGNPSSGGQGMPEGKGFFDAWGSETVSLKNESNIEGAK